MTIKKVNKVTDHETNLQPDIAESHRADSELIHWLLHDSGISRYQISKALNISESTLSRLASGETPMDSIRFGYAMRLTTHAEAVKAARKSEEGANTP